MIMKKYISLIFVLAFAGVFFAFGQTSAEKADSLLKLAEDNTAFYDTDFSGNYTVVQDKPGEGRNVTEALMYRRDRQKKWTILITGPAKEKGKGYLQYDGNVWFYDPQDHRFTFTSAHDKFQNTNANNSDFMPQRYYSDYTIDSFDDVILGNLNCVRYSLKAKVDNVDYPILKLWVTKDDGLVRKKEDYSLSEKKLRTTLVPSYQKIAGNESARFIPVSMLIVDNLRGKKIEDKMKYERTQITITNAAFGPQSDSVYTKPYLEMMSDK